MDPVDFQQKIKGLREYEITSDEPHVSMRCEENDFKLENIKRIIINQEFPLVRVIQDRANVYKAYYRLSRKTELKVIVSIFDCRKLNIRTVRRLRSDFKLGRMKRQRF